MSTKSTPIPHSIPVTITATATDYSPAWPVGLWATYLPTVQVLDVANNKGVHSMLDAWLYEFEPTAKPRRKADYELLLWLRQPPEWQHNRQTSAISEPPSDDYSPGHQEKESTKMAKVLLPLEKREYVETEYEEAQKMAPAAFSEPLIQCSMLLQQAQRDARKYAIARHFVSLQETIQTAFYSFEVGPQDLDGMIYVLAAAIEGLETQQALEGIKKGKAKS